VLKNNQVSPVNPVPPAPRPHHQDRLSIAQSRQHAIPRNPKPGRDGDIYKTLQERAEQHCQMPRFMGFRRISVTPVILSPIITSV
jgi:hypothetical protein